MKKSLLFALCLMAGMQTQAQGWPANYGGVMLQGFYWDSFDDTRWDKLEGQADELAAYYNLIWVPQSGKCLESYNTMGYTPYYYFNQNSSFGSESSLRSMIRTFKQKGLGTVADVVVNHHNTSGWFTFPAEIYNGQTYQLQSTDIVRNDDGGKTLTQANKDAVALSANNDEGEGWDGMRDLDHMSANVQQIMKAYVKYLKDDLGYTGFRYDMVKGFAASHVGDYNDAAGIEYSVGEYWDSNERITNWIKQTGYRSAAFDFQFRYNVRDAINNNDWSKLNSTYNLMHDARLRRYAITFVENHDTQYRSATEQLDPIRRDTLAANAYLLAMPGTPCVFLKHWQAYKPEIKNMIGLRKFAGITNLSNYDVVASTNFYHAVNSHGTQSDLLVVVGNVSMYNPGAQWVKVSSGYHYAHYLPVTASKVWADRASGTYTGSVSVLLTAATNVADAEIVYTLDGSAPSLTNGQRVKSGTRLDITESSTLRMALLQGGVVSAEISRQYVIAEPFVPQQIKVYVNVDEAGAAWTSSSYLNFWTWGGDGSHAPASGKWPGDRVSSKETVAGKQWYVKEFTLNSADDYVSLVLSIGSGSPQSVDIPNVTKTAYFKVVSALEGGKNKVEDVSATTSVKGLQASSVQVLGVFNLQGQRLGDDVRGLRPGIYIVNGRKQVVK